jgi:HK97 family phage prohead protease
MTTTIDRKAAAEARRANIRAAADRPSQRRCSHFAGSPAAQRVAATEEIREKSEGGALHFHGLASATDAPYEMYDMFGPYTELVVPGAFGKTLAQVDLDVPLVLDHDSMRRIADTVTGTLSLSETDLGLEVDAPNLDPTDADVAYIVPKIRAGLIREMSFRFRITRGSWSPDWMEYHIEEVDIHRGDVAIVGYGANPATVSELRSQRHAESQRSIDLTALSDDFVRDEFRRLRNELRSRGLAIPMSLEDIA